MSIARTHMAVVVMGYRNAATIERAVRSVLDQQAAATFEVLVVTSGGDETATIVHERFPEVRVIESPTRLLPGGARNAGVAAADADIVAFLAADCIALPGWVERRMHHHARGRRAVASAIVPGLDDRLVGRAAAYLLFPGRLTGHPEGPANQTQAFGLSFERSLLDELGPFDGALRIGEDSLMLAKLRMLGVTPWFDPAIRTAHPGPTTAWALARDQFGRGRLRYDWEAMAPPGRARRRLEAARSRGELALLAGGLASQKIWQRARHTARNAKAGSDDRRTLVQSAPLMAMGVIANQVGWGVACYRSARDAPTRSATVERAARRTVPIALDGADRVVALTFDDHPQGTTAELLDRLAALDVPATFFVCAERVRGQEDLLRRMIADGHAIGIHGLRHDALTELDVEAIEAGIRRSAALVADVIRWPVSLLRPPDGRYDARVVRAAADVGLTTWLWTVDPATANGHVLDELAAGAVVRVTDHSAPALDALVRGARERGFRFVALPSSHSTELVTAARV